MYTEHSSSLCNWALSMRLAIPTVSSCSLQPRGTATQLPFNHHHSPLLPSTHPNSWPLPQSHVAWTDEIRVARPILPFPGPDSKATILEFWVLRKTPASWGAVCFLCSDLVLISSRLCTSNLSTLCWAHRQLLPITPKASCYKDAQVPTRLSTGR